MPDFLKNTNLLYAFAAFLILVVILPTVDYYLISGGFGIVGQAGAIFGGILTLFFVVVAFVGRKA